MGDTEVFGIALHENAVGHGDGKQPLATRRLPIGHPRKKAHVLGGRGRGEGNQQILFAAEMLIQRTDRVFAKLGQSRHLKAQQALVANEVTGGVEKHLFAVEKLPLSTLLDPHEDRSP